DSLAELERDAAEAPASASRQRDSPAERISAFEVTARIRLVDHRDACGVPTVGGLEQPSDDGPETERLEELGRDLIGVCKLIVLRQAAADHGIGAERHRE